ncbi:MAG: hypothetical protein PQ964_01130 [Methanobacteriaceae archaeon]|jgi:hypothetical protein
MNAGKMGKIFIVLMISLIAFGCGSLANVLNAGNDITESITLPNIEWNNQTQISVIGNPSFEPVHVMRHFYNNTTNSTNSTPITNNSINNTAGAVHPEDNLIVNYRQRNGNNTTRTVNTEGEGN